MFYWVVVQNPEETHKTVTHKTQKRGTTSPETAVSQICWAKKKKSQKKRFRSFVVIIINKSRTGGYLRPCRGEAERVTLALAACQWRRDRSEAEFEVRAGHFRPVAPGKELKLLARNVSESAGVEYHVCRALAR